MQVQSQHAVTDQKHVIHGLPGVDATVCVCRLELRGSDSSLTHIPRVSCESTSLVPGSCTMSNSVADPLQQTYNHICSSEYGNEAREGTN